MFVLLLAALPVLDGCHLRHSARRDECAPSAVYNQARVAEPLHSAEGLPPPNTHNALKIPDEVAIAKPHRQGTACLDTPPSFYADRPRPAPPPKKK